MLNLCSALFCKEENRPGVGNTQKWTKDIENVFETHKTGARTLNMDIRHSAPQSHKQYSIFAMHCLKEEKEMRANPQSSLTKRPKCKTFSSQFLFSCSYFLQEESDSLSLGQQHCGSQERQMCYLILGLLDLFAVFRFVCSAFL